jgi:hypothetical protein
MGLLLREERVILKRSECAPMVMQNEIPDENFRAGLFAHEPVWVEASSEMMNPSLSTDEAQILTLRHPALPGPIEIHQVIEDTMTALPDYVQQDYTIVVEPFESSLGKCAILQDSFGKRYCLLEKPGRRQGSFSGRDISRVRH